MGRPPGPRRERLHLRVLPETKQRLEEHAALAGIDMNVAVDEWSRLVQDRDDLVQELRRVEDDALTKQQGYLAELRARKKAHDRLLAEVEKYRARRSRGAPPMLSDEYREKMRIKHLQDVARLMTCSMKGCKITWMDLDAGHHICAPCRKEKVQQLLSEA